MNRFLPIMSLLPGLAVVAVPPVEAQSLDVNQLLCRELLAQDEDTIAIMLLWMDGYLSGVTGDTRFNPGYLETFAERVGEACAKSPNTSVLDVAKIVGID